jgi:hypothetical protein
VGAYPKVNKNPESVASSLEGSSKSRRSKCVSNAKSVRGPGRVSGRSEVFSSAVERRPLLPLLPFWGCQQVRVLNCPSLPRAACLTCFKFCVRMPSQPQERPLRPPFPRRRVQCCPREGSTTAAQLDEVARPIMRAGCCASERASAAGGERFHVEQAARAATATATATVTATEAGAETRGGCGAPRRAAGRSSRRRTRGSACSGPGPGAASSPCGPAGSPGGMRGGACANGGGE